MRWFSAKREKGSKSATVRIFEQIGKDWFGDGTDAKSFTTAVDGLGEDLDTLNVHINSPGGNVYDGLAIYNYLKRHKAQVVVYIDGIAASIASIIALAGDKIIMPANSTQFIHNPWTFAGGDAAALRKSADELETIRDSLLGIYLSRSNLSRDTIIGMMDAETLITAEEAVNWGFADEIEQASAIAASLDPDSVMAGAKARAEQELQSNIQAQRYAALQADLEAAQALIEEQQAAFAGLQTKYVAATTAPPAMEPKTVLAAVKAAGVPEWLGARLIEEQATEEAVTASVQRHSGISGALVAAGLTPESTDAICRENWNDIPSLVCALLVEIQAQAEDEINNRLTNGLPGSPSALDHKAIYSKRRPQSQTRSSNK